MKKQKLKLSLIDDYVQISLIKNFLNNNIQFTNESVGLMKSTQDLDNMLEQIYLSIFKTLKFDDPSFQILKKELHENNSLFLNTRNCDFKNLDKILNQCNLKLNQILHDLKLKSDKLKLNLSNNFSIN
ncbi:MAG: hypothetical protein IJ415_04250 [Clostridia bacterium]|nr:hypothetical protein [Clostridia bacterium]